MAVLLKNRGGSAHCDPLAPCLAAQAGSSGLLLQRPHVGVAPALGQQLAVAATLVMRPASMTRISCASTTVDRRCATTSVSALRNGAQLVLDGALVGRVQGTGGLVKDQDGGVFQQRVQWPRYAAGQARPRSPTWVA